MGETSSIVSGGLLAATRNSAATLLTSGRTRLELLGNELREEKLHALHLLLIAQMGAFCLMVGTLLAVLLLTVLFWNERVALLAILTAVFLAGGLAFFLTLRHLSHRSRHLFKTSLGEIGEDIRQLKGTARNEPETD